jgi:hypothetical protein
MLLFLNQERSSLNKIDWGLLDIFPFIAENLERPVLNNTSM